MPNQKKRSISPKVTQLLRWVIVGLGICCIVFGICHDGVAAMVANAIALCLSCIGLG